MKKNNVITVEASNFLFVDFSDEALKHASEEDRESEWFTELNELDGKIHSRNVSDKITFADDRLTQIAYQVLCKTDIFTDRVGLREWWILKRYADIYMPNTLELKPTIEQVVTMYIGFNFTGAQMSAIQKEEAEGALDTLRKQVFEEDYPQPLPQFFLDLVEAGKMPENEFAGNEQKQYEGLKEIAEIMLQDRASLTEEEITLWEQALNEANEFLK